MANQPDYLQNAIVEIKMALWSKYILQDHPKKRAINMFRKGWLTADDIPQRHIQVLLDAIDGEIKAISNDQQLIQQWIDTKNRLAVLLLR